MNIVQLKEVFSPWIDVVIQDFSKSFLNDYGSDILEYLHENIEKEIENVYMVPIRQNNNVIKRSEALYTALTYLYNHLCWKISRHEVCPNVKRSCVKLLTQIIKTGLIVSKGNPKSEWINRILTAIKLFTGGSTLIYDSLLLIIFLKRKYHQAYITVLKCFLTSEDHECITDPLIYMEVILLFRRLKGILENRNHLARIMSLACKIKPPSNIIPWLMALDAQDVSELKYKTIGKQLMTTKVSRKLTKKIRDIALYCYVTKKRERIQETAKDPSNLFVIDSSSTVGPNYSVQDDKICSPKNFQLTESSCDPILEMSSPQKHNAKKSKRNKKQLILSKKDSKEKLIEQVQPMDIDSCVTVTKNNALEKFKKKNKKLIRNKESSENKIYENTEVTEEVQPIYTESTSTHLSKKCLLKKDATKKSKKKMNFALNKENSQEKIYEETEVAEEVQPVSMNSLYVPISKNKSLKKRNAKKSKRNKKLVRGTENSEEILETKDEPSNLFVIDSSYAADDYSHSIKDYEICEERGIVEQVQPMYAEPCVSVSKKNLKKGSLKKSKKNKKHRQANYLETTNEPSELFVIDSSPTVDHYNHSIQDGKLCIDNVPTSFTDPFVPISKNRLEKTKPKRLKKSSCINAAADAMEQEFEVIDIAESDSSSQNASAIKSGYIENHETPSCTSIYSPDVSRKVTISFSVNEVSNKKTKKLKRLSSLRHGEDKCDTVVTSCSTSEEINIVPKNVFIKSKKLNPSSVTDEISFIDDAKDHNSLQESKEMKNKKRKNFKDTDSSFKKKSLKLDENKKPCDSPLFDQNKVSDLKIASYPNSSNFDSKLQTSMDLDISERSYYSMSTEHNLNKAVKLSKNNDEALSSKASLKDHISIQVSDLCQKYCVSDNSDVIRNDKMLSENDGVNDDLISNLLEEYSMDIKNLNDNEKETSITQKDALLTISDHEQGTKAGYTLLHKVSKNQSLSKEIISPETNVSQQDLNSNRHTQGNGKDTHSHKSKHLKSISSQTDEVDESCIFEVSGGIISKINFSSIKNAQIPVNVLCSLKSENLQSVKVSEEIILSDNNSRSEIPAVNSSVLEDFKYDRSKRHNLKRKLAEVDNLSSVEDSDSITEIASNCGPIETKNKLISLNSESIDNHEPIQISRNDDESSVDSESSTSHNKMIKVTENKNESVPQSSDSIDSHKKSVKVSDKGNVLASHYSGYVNSPNKPINASKNKDELVLQNSESIGSHNMSIKLSEKEDSMLHISESIDSPKEPINTSEDVNNLIPLNSNIVDFHKESIEVSNKENLLVLPNLESIDSQNELIEISNKNNILLHPNLETIHSQIEAIEIPKTKGTSVPLNSEFTDSQNEQVHALKNKIKAVSLISESIDSPNDAIKFPKNASVPVPFKSQSIDSHVELIEIPENTDKLESIISSDKTEGDSLNQSTLAIDSTNASSLTKVSKFEIYNSEKCVIKEDVLTASTDVNSNLSIKSDVDKLENEAVIENKLPSKMPHTLIAAPSTHDKLKLKCDKSGVPDSVNASSPTSSKFEIDNSEKHFIKEDTLAVSTDVNSNPSIKADVNKLEIEAVIDNKSPTKMPQSLMATPSTHDELQLNCDKTKFTDTVNSSSPTKVSKFEIDNSDKSVIKEDILTASTGVNSNPSIKSDVDKMEKETVIGNKNPTKMHQSLMATPSTHDELQLNCDKTEFTDTVNSSSPTKVSKFEIDNSDKSVIKEDILTASTGVNSNPSIKADVNKLEIEAVIDSKSPTKMPQSLMATPTHDELQLNCDKTEFTDTVNSSSRTKVFKFEIDKSVIKGDILTASTDVNSNPSIKSDVDKMEKETVIENKSPTMMPQSLMTTPSTHNELQLNCDKTELFDTVNASSPTKVSKFEIDNSDKSVIKEDILTASTDVYSNPSIKSDVDKMEKETVIENKSPTKMPQSLMTIPSTHDELQLNCNKTELFDTVNASSPTKVSKFEIDKSVIKEDILTASTDVNSNPSIKSDVDKMEKETVIENKSPTKMPQSLMTIPSTHDELQLNCDKTELFDTVNASSPTKVLLKIDNSDKSVIKEDILTSLTDVNSNQSIKSDVDKMEKETVIENKSPTKIPQSLIATPSTHDELKLNCDKPGLSDSSLSKESNLVLKNSSCESIDNVYQVLDDSECAIESEHSENDVADITVTKLHITPRKETESLNLKSHCPNKSTVDIGDVTEIDDNSVTELHSTQNNKRKSPTLKAPPECSKFRISYESEAINLSIPNKKMKYSSRTSSNESIDVLNVSDEQCEQQDIIKSNTLEITNFKHFSFSCENEEYITFSDISVSNKSASTAVDPDVKCSNHIKNFAFAATTEIFSSYRNDLFSGEDKASTGAVSKDDVSFYSQELSDDGKSQNLSSDDVSESDHSICEEIDNQLEEVENTLEKPLNSDSTNELDASQFESLNEQKTEAIDKSSLSPISENKCTKDTSSNEVSTKLPRHSSRLRSKADIKRTTVLSEDPEADSCKKDADEESEISTTASEKDGSSSICIVKTDDYPESLDRILKNSSRKCVPRKSKSKQNSLRCSPPKRYSLRLKNSKGTDESSNLGIDISRLHLDSPSSSMNPKVAIKRNDLVAKMLALEDPLEETSDHSDTILSSKRETRSTVAKTSKDDDSTSTPGYNLRTRRSIIAPGKLNL